MTDSLMVYYTFEGNTGFVAEELQKHRDIVVEQLTVEHEPPRKGFGKFLHGGKSALTGANPSLRPLTHDPAAFSKIVIAFPVWAGTYPPAIGAFLKEYPLKDKSIYVIACSASGNAAKAIEAVGKALPSCQVAASLSLRNPLKERETASRKVAEFAAEIK